MRLWLCHCALFDLGIDLKCIADPTRGREKGGKATVAFILRAEAQ